MEQILYYIVINRNLLISFLILIFFLGIICFLSMRNFKQDRKGKIIFYGLFLQMTNLDILKLSILIVKSFIIIFTICITEKTQLYISMISIGILTIMYSIVYLKRFFHEIISSAFQIFAIYMSFIINGYSQNIDNSNLVMIIYCFIIIALIFFTAYTFLKEIEEISYKRAKDNNEKSSINRKELNEDG